MTMQDRVCLITGGAGHWWATAEVHRRRGHRRLRDLNEAAGSETAAALGERAFFACVDVTDRAPAQAWVDAIVAEHGRIDAGQQRRRHRDNQLMGQGRRLVKQMPVEDFDQ